MQTDPALANARRGFFLVYINSFNEWHEGHAFEPMKDAAELTRRGARAAATTTPRDGAYRLETLRRAPAPVLAARARSGEAGG